MEVEVKEFGVRIRLVVEPYTPTPEEGQHEDEENQTGERPPMQSAWGVSPAVAAETVATVEEIPQGDPDPAPIHRPHLERQVRNWRREEAIRRGVPTYIIMTERTIKSIVADPPVDLEQLSELKGVGPKTMELYGEALLELIQNTDEEE